ncbi:MAG: lysylphosphatidylglycerol synthase transmembrane domain-containing protein [Candidatus Aenigmatarchaeota archaeon]
MKKKAIPLVLAIIIFAAWFWLSNPAKMLESIASANILFVLSAVALTLVSISMKAFRWQTLLKGINVAIPFSLAFSSFISATAISVLTPGRVGEPVRGLILKKKNGTNFSETLPLIITERVLDLIVALSFAIAGIIVMGSALSADIRLFLNLSAVVSAAALVLVVSALLSERLGKTFVGILLKLPIGRMKPKIEHVASSFYESSRKIKIGTVFFISLITLLTWVVEGGILFFSVKSIGFDLSLLTAIEIISLAQIIGLVSSLPGGLGSVETVLTLLILPFLLALPAASAATIIYRFASLWVGMAIGVFFLARLLGLGYIKEQLV